MNYELFINQKKISAGTKNAVAEYIKRLSPFCKVTVIPCKKAPKPVPDAYNIQLLPDKTGTQTISSEQFAAKINRMNINGYSHICYYIGFPASDAYTESFFISSMSMSDEVTLIAFTEQLYRAYTINNHITYHK